jgi:hypothetical protein
VDECGIRTGHMNVDECGIGTEAVLFPEKEYINWILVAVHAMSY